MWMIWAAAAWAAQVDLAIDTNDVREGQTVGLSVTVHDAEAKSVPSLTLPTGLSASFESQSQQHMILNFKASQSTTYRYALTAMKAGSYTIGPISVATSAGALTSDSLKVEVGARPTGTGAAEALLSELGTTVLYVGQVATLHLRFATERALINGEWHPPDVDGLTVEPSVQPLPSRARLEQDGKPFQVEELYYPLRASKPGSHVLPGAVLQAQFAVSRRRGTRSGEIPMFQDIPGFTDVRTETFSAQPTTLDVRPLPTEGRPASFTGLVGRFAMAATPSASTVAVGQTVTVQVEVSGDGPLGGTTLPPLTGEGFAVYDDKPSVEAAITDGRYAAKAVFKRAIVPDRPGPLTLPPLELSWFDPTAGTYHTEVAPQITLQVTGEAKQTDVTSYSEAVPKPVDRLGEDILPMRADARVAAPLPGTWAWALLIPGLGMLLMQLAPKIRLPERRVQAGPARWTPIEGDAETRLAELDRRFREAAAGRVGCTPEALRREQAATLGPECESLYRELEQLRYRHGEGVHPEDRVRRFVEGA